MTALNEMLAISLEKLGAAHISSHRRIEVKQPSGDMLVLEISLRD